MPSATPGSSRGYTKVKDIGHGSYGKALLVQDAEGKLYVMKTIDMSNMDRKQRREAINEVQVLSNLKHPYIVSYRESFSENSTLAIIMDYADGGDLYQRIGRTRKAGQSIPERQIIRWFTEAALALKYMHDKHVLHRDLKTQNLFLTSSDRLRVGDFGISKVLESTAAFARTAIGTPYYLSPEICQEKPYSFGCDVWALGCVLFELCALRVPFDAQNIQELVRKITRAPLPQIPPHYSQELRHLCGDLLHRDQSSRPTATEIIQRRYVQEEIRRMLHEERAKAAATAAVTAPGAGVGGVGSGGTGGGSAGASSVPPPPPSDRGVGSSFAFERGSSKPASGGPGGGGGSVAAAGKPASGGAGLGAREGSFNAGAAPPVSRRPSSYRSYSPAPSNSYAPYGGGVGVGFSGGGGARAAAHAAYASPSHHGAQYGAPGPGPGSCYTPGVPPAVAHYDYSSRRF